MPTDEYMKQWNDNYFREFKEWWDERERQHPDGFTATKIELVGTIQEKPAYKIECPLCHDLVLWFDGAWWKLECHCNLLFTVTKTDSGIGAVGRRQ